MINKFVLAFGHADVVLLCFSIASENSLRNIKAPLKKLTVKTLLYSKIMSSLNSLLNHSTSSSVSAVNCGSSLPLREIACKILKWRLIYCYSSGKISIVRTLDSVE